MPQLEYFLAAQSHAFDRDSGALSIFHVVSEVRAAEGFPFVLPSLHLISCWFSSDAEIAQSADHQAAMVVKRPGAAPDAPFRFNFTSGVRFQHLVVGQPALEVAQPGLLEFELQLNGERRATHRVYVLPPEAE